SRSPEQQIDTEAAAASAAALDEGPAGGQPDLDVDGQQQDFAGDEGMGEFDPSGLDGSAFDRDLQGSRFTRGLKKVAKIAGLGLIGVAAGAVLVAGGLPIAAGLAAFGA